MKNITILAALAALFIAGCGTKDEAATEPATTTGATASSSTATPPLVAVAYDLGSKKVGDHAACAICTIKEGKPGDEEVKATLDYEGKTYVFCEEAEKAEFISDPKKYTGGK